jgi:hypothetical protein
MARALDGDFAPRAHTSLLDAALALAMAAGGVRPLLRRRGQFQAALAAGFGADDDARLLSLLQQQFDAGAAQPAGGGSVSPGAPA